MTSKIAIVLLSLSLLAAGNAAARAPAPKPLIHLAPTPATLAPSSGTPHYDLLKAKASEIEEKRTTDGLAYIISGAVVLGVSLPAYYLTEDVFARAVYSLGQTLGVASIGYGSYLRGVDDDTTRFYHLITRTPLTPKNREELSEGYLQDSARVARNSRKIRVITHSLTGALNFVNGATTSNRELKTALFFVGGINVLAALSFGLTESEDERQTAELSKTSAKLSVHPILRPDSQSLDPRSTSGMATRGVAGGVGIQRRF